MPVYAVGVEHLKKWHVLKTVHHWGKAFSRISYNTAILLFGYSLNFETLHFFSTGATAVQIAQFGQGTGPIFLDGIRCTGIEDRLVDCNHNGFGVHNCTSTHRAGVVCPSKQLCMM